MEAVSVKSRVQKRILHVKYDTIATFNSPIVVIKEYSQALKGYQVKEVFKKTFHAWC